MIRKPTKRFCLVVLCCMLCPFLTAAPAEEPGEEDSGNNLSFPVIWAEGISKVLPGTYGTPVLQGEWWYWWGADELGPLSCPPDPDDEAYCNDGLTGSVGQSPGVGWVRGYLQKDDKNSWQAWSSDGSLMPVNIDVLDWGDSAESVGWVLNSMVRAEVVLYETLPELALEYQMRHLSGWGIDEMHGLSVNQLGEAETGPGESATVYSHCARFVIQKILVDRDDPALADATWNAVDGYWEGEGLFDTEHGVLFNKAVWEVEDGRGSYSAELNIKGKIIYGYTWSVRELNDGEGDYRMTFAFDGVEKCPAFPNAFFTEETEILLPVEEEVITEEGEEPDEGPGGGAVAVIDVGNNLTYIDIRITDGRDHGGGNGNGGKDDSGGNGGNDDSGGNGNGGDS